MVPIDMSGKVAIITGAGRGLGRASALKFAQAGADVVIVDVVMENAQSVAKEAQALGVRSKAYATDVTDADAMEKMVDEVVAEFGRLDVMFNNAGAGMAGEVKDSTLEDWERMWSVNVKGVIHGIHAVYPHMIVRGEGHIVNISSGAGIVPQGGMAHYVAAKHAVTGL